MTASTASRSPVLQGRSATTRRAGLLAVAALSLLACEAMPPAAGPRTGSLGLRAVVLPTPAAPAAPRLQASQTGRGEVNRLVADTLLDQPGRELAAAFAADGVSAAERLRRHLLARLGAAGLRVREVPVPRPEVSLLRDLPDAADTPVLDTVLLAFGYDVLRFAYRPTALLQLRVTGPGRSVLLEETIGVGLAANARWRTAPGPDGPAFRTLPALRDGGAQAIAGLDAAIDAAAAEVARRIGPAA